MKGKLNNNEQNKKTKQMNKVETLNQNKYAQL